MARMVWRALACSATVFVFDHFMNTSLRTLTLAAAVASLFPAVALGQTAPEQQTEESPPVVVTATRVAQPLTDVLADVTLIDEQHPLEWLSADENFFDWTKYAGEGNIGHMVEQVKIYGMGIK